MNFYTFSIVSITQQSLFNTINISKHFYNSHLLINFFLFLFAIIFSKKQYDKNGGCRGDGVLQQAQKQHLPAALDLPGAVVLGGKGGDGHPDGGQGLGGQLVDLRGGGEGRHRLSDRQLPQAERQVSEK